MEVLNSVLEHILNLYSRIENRETDIITKIQEYYLKAQYRKEGYHPYCDAKGELDVYKRQVPVLLLQGLRRYAGQPGQPRGGRLQVVRR